MADPLVILARLRRLQATQAKRGLAEALAEEGRAKAATDSASDAMRNEARAAPSDAAHPLAHGHAAWLPAGQAAVHDARATEVAAAAAVEHARAALAQLRAAESAVAHVFRERADLARARTLKRQQAELENALAAAAKQE